MNDRATILAVDDTSESLALLVNVLIAEGYHVRPADSGELALAAVALNPPDLILLDVRMPGMDGFEVCRRLRARAESHNIPIVFITASVGQAERVEGLKLGAVDFITKPIQREELLARIQTHLELSRTRAQLEEQTVALRQANAQLHAEGAERQRVADELRQSLDRAERSRRAMLSTLEDRKRAEAALRASEEKYRLLVENLNDTIYTLDTAGRFSYISPVVERFSGYKTTDLSGRVFADFIHPDDLPRLLECYSRTLRGEIDPLEYRIFDRDGAVRHIRTSSRLIHDAGGAIIGTTGVMTDVSEQVQAREALAIRAHQQAVVAELGQLALRVTDLQALFDRTVTRVAETFGVEYCKVLELLPDGSAVKLVAGVGWKPGLVGTAAVGVGLDSQAGFTLRTDQPVIVADLRTETRFSGPQLLHDHGIVSGISVVISGPDRPFGVLGVHTARQRTFTSDDAYFCQAVANVLAEAIQRQRAESALRESQERFRAVVETAPDAIFIQTRGCFAYLNPAALALFDVADNSQLLGRSVMDRFHPDYRELVRERIQQLNEARREVPRLVEKILRSDGRAVDVEVSAVPFTYQGEQGALVFASDITERLRAEAERVAERTLLRTLVDNLPDSVYVKDAAGRKTLANPANLRHISAMSEADVLGKTDFELFPPDLAAAFDADDRHIIQTGQPIINREERFTRPDGTFGWQLTSKVPLRDHTGQIIGLVGIGHDITERKEAEEALRATLADLQRSNADLERFAYVSSHDLQEPLRMVASYVQLLAIRYRGRLDADADEFIGYAVEGAARMQQLILDLLEYSRVGTHGRPLQPTDTTLVCQAALRNLELAITESGATVTCDPLPTVNADAAQLMQVFQNLIGNALKFHGAEPPQVHISAHETCEVSAKVWKFAVQDNGIGIAPEYFDRIFIIFQRLHTRDVYEGTGIGLAVCKRIIERHGGRIWVESAPGQGATFYFTLPALT